MTIGNEASAATCAACGMALAEDETLHSELLETLKYNPETGDLFWKKTRGGPGAKAGCKAGSLKTTGYIIVRFKMKLYPAHRLIWFYVHGKWPEHEIDHINGLKADNRIVNLREATRSQNVMNIGRRNKNRSGFIGVSKVSEGKKWQARISLKGKTYYLGVFPTPEEAHSAYCRIASELHGEFANTDNHPDFLRNGNDHG